MASYLYDGDLDAVLANLPLAERPRAIVDHFDSLADEFVTEFLRGLTTGLT